MVKDEKRSQIAPHPWPRRLLEAGFFLVVIAVLWTVYLILEGFDFGAHLDKRRGLFVDGAAHLGLH